jgi:plasmid stabilization system protein ParE
MKLRFTRRATQDLIDIADYIRAQSRRLPARARRYPRVVAESHPISEVGRRQQTRDRYAHRLRNDPGSAVHRFAALALHRIRDTLSGGSPGAPSP